VSTNAYTGRANSLGPLFEAVEQAKQIERVSSRIGRAVLRFCASHRTFHASELRDYVVAEGFAAPASPDRILRDLRQRGLLNYRVVDRRKIAI